MPVRGHLTFRQRCVSHRAAGCGVRTGKPVLEDVLKGAAAFGHASAARDKPDGRVRKLRVLQLCPAGRCGCLIKKHPGSFRYGRTVRIDVADELIVGAVVDEIVGTVGGQIARCNSGVAVAEGFGPGAVYVEGWACGRIRDCEAHGDTRTRGECEARAGDDFGRSRGFGGAAAVMGDVGRAVEADPINGTGGGKFGGGIRFSLKTACCGDSTRYGASIRRQKRLPRSVPGECMVCLSAGRCRHKTAHSVC